MIKLIESIAEIDGILKTDSVYKAKILSNIDVYGELPIINTWQINNSAVFQMINSDGILTGDISDDEVLDFARFMNCKTVFTSKKIADKLSLETNETGQIMIRGGSIIKPESRYSEIAFPEYSKIYSLLERCGFNLPEKDGFLSDLHLKVHKKSARILANDDYSALLISCFETEKMAVLSAVCVDKDLRRKNIGSDMINSLCGILQNKTIYLYREIDKNEQFYYKNGFENCGLFANCNI